MPPSHTCWYSAMGFLYDTRSAIVHNGLYQVTESDLGLIRPLATKALVRVSRKLLG